MKRQTERQQRGRHTKRERETEEMRETLNERWEKGLRKREIDGETERTEGRIRGRGVGGIIN